jgi:cytoskeletal protein RodZ
MALSMDEQRVLAEIERRLAAEEPGLASNLASFRIPSRLSVFRSTRARVIGSLFTVAVVAMVSLMVYAMLPFRSSGRTTGHQPVTTTSTGSGPGLAKIGPAPAKTKPKAKPKSSAASSSSAQSSASGSHAAGTTTSPSARARASNSAHASGAAAVAQSATSASAAAHGP